MRELTVSIRFVLPCLGNVRDGSREGRFLLPRSPSGAVMFLASWHQLNMKLAAKMLGRWHTDVKKILWDVEVDGALGADRWYRRYYDNLSGSRRRHVVHEAFLPGQIVGINCVAPPSIPEEDLWALFRLAGKYKGLSPFRPGEYGQFEVESIVARRVMSRPQQKEETERTASGGLDSIEKPPIVETNFI
jgi:hypothetical protein